MRTRAKDIDDYIAHAPEGARSILVKLRSIFRRASPKLLEEIKWGVPCFTCQGPVGGFAAYRNHVSWGLWKSRLLNDPAGLLDRRGIVMGGKIATVADIPPASELMSLIRQVIALNESGIKNPKPPRPQVPADFGAAMKKSAAAGKQFAAFTPARQWQYVNWINQAKRPETRAKRIHAAVERISAGKTMK